MIFKTCLLDVELAYSLQYEYRKNKIKKTNYEF